MKKISIDYSEYTPVKNKVNLRSIVGVRNGKVVVTELIGRKNRRTYYKAVCDCGNELIVRADHINESCGCVPCNKGGYFKDLTGKRFGKLVALEHIKLNNKYFWKCKCDRGNFVNVSIENLGRSTNSCGCYKVDKLTTHNLHNHRLYKIFQRMKQRCYNQKSSDYYLYGARGIKICDEWINDFMCFYNWAIENGYKDSLSIDRINVNGNYEPSNCRWATAIEQAHNKR